MSSSREGRAPPPPSSFARTPSSNRSSVSPDNRRQSAIFVGKIPLSITPASTKDSSPLHASTASTSSSSSSSSNRSSSSLQRQHQQGQDPSNNDDITSSSSSTFKRPSKSTRRPSLQNGLPSPPFTSSEGSGGSIRLPNQTQPPQPPPSSFQHSLHRDNSTSSGQSEEDIDNSLVMDGYDSQQHEQARATTTSRRSSLTSSRREQRGDQERDQRIKDLKERNVKIIDHLATLSSSLSNARYSSDSPATPSPTRSSYRTAPPSSSSNSTSSSTKSTRRSSLPAPPPTTTFSNGRLIKPPLRDDAGWEVSAGEETERAYSSGGGSPSGSGGGGWGERDLQQQRRPNLPRSGFSGSSAEGGPETYRLPPSVASPSHERTSSLGSDGALSRRSSRSGGSRGPGGGPSASLHTQSQSMSSLDHPTPPPSSITTTNQSPRVARDAPSSLRTTALHRSQSTSTTGSGSSSGRPALQPRQGSDGSSHSRVVPSPSGNRSRAGSGGSPSSGSLHQTLRISPSVRSTRGSLAGLANSRETSPSPRSQQPPFSAARSTFASRQAVRSNSQASSLASPFSSPDKEINGRGSTTETVGRRRANGGETSTAGGEQRSDERATRERQTSGGAKRRAPLPMEFRNDGSPPEPAPPAPPPPRNPRITTTAPTLSKRSVDLDRSSPNRASPEFYTASGSSTLTHNTSPRISRVLPPSRSRTIRGNGYDEQDRPRYLRRGGSAESALAEKDGKRGGEENNGRDLFSRDEKSAGAVGGGSGGTREILARIERETAEREEKKRELLESQALRRAESVMASSKQQERTYQQHQQHDRPESSMSRTEDFNRRFPPRTPTASTTRNSVRHTPQTMAPLRPSTAMSSFMDDAPRTAPPIGQHHLRSHRSIYNIQAAAAREDASPSPSQLLRSRNAINNDLSRAAAGTPTRQSTFDRNQSLRRAATPSSASPYHPRAMTSIDFPTSTSSHSNFSASTSSGPLENMVKAFAHLEAYYSPLSLHSSDAIIRSANALMSSAESTNTSIAQVLAFTRQQLVDAEVNDMPLDFIDGLNQVSFDLKEAKKTSDEEIRQLVDLMAALPRLGRELGAAGGGGGGSSDGGRDDRMFAGVRSRHSSLEKGGSPSLVGRNDSRRSMDFHSREASEPAPSRFADSHYTRPSTSQQTYSSITTSPSSRFQRDTLQPRPRLPSIPSVRQFVNDARAAADSSSTSTVSAAPFPRTGDSSTSLNSQTLSPPRKRTSVLAHVFDRFSNKQEDPASSTDKLPSPDRTWRQAKLSSTSTVRATSLFPSGPKVSEPTTAISTVTATHGSPSRTTSGLPLDPESYDENDDSPRPKISATASFLNRARTMSMHPGSGESSPRRGSGDPRRTSFAEDEDIHASGSGSEESAERRRRMSLPPAGSMTSTSPSSVLRRLPGIFGGGSPKKKDTTGLP